MQVELKIDAEAVQRNLVDSLIQSGIGEQIKKAIQTEINKSSWNSGTIVEQAVRAALHDELRSLCRKVLEEQREDLRARIVAALTEGVITKAIGSLVDRIDRDPPR